MANELVRLNLPPTPAVPIIPLTDADGVPWDLPPEYDPAVADYARPHKDGAPRNPRQKRINTNQGAERDAHVAEQQGDHEFAAVRSTDAAEHRQARYDWGDTRTWLWIAAMFFGFLILVGIVYYMPYGRHNQADGGNQGGHPTPTIRVY